MQVIRQQAMQQFIEDKLIENFSPDYLEVTNESHMHSVAPGSETHFKVVIISEQFNDKRLLMRHRSVYSVLAQALEQGVHALALHTYTPKEWHVLEDTLLTSPACHGGNGR